MKNYSLVHKLLFCGLCVLGFPFSASAVLITGVEIMPTTLPDGFTPTAGKKVGEGEYVIGGVFQDKAAYIRVTADLVGGGAPTISAVNILPSLGVVADPVNGNPNGAVLDVVVTNSGELQFVGSSFSLLSHPSFFGEATVWSESGNPVGLGFVPVVATSELNAGTMNEIYVGIGNDLPVIGSIGTGLHILPTSNLFGLANGANADGSIVVGADLQTLSYWTANDISSFDYTLHNNLQNPDNGINLGELRGILGDWVYGVYLDLNTFSEAGGVWDITNDALLVTFGAGTDVTTGDIIDGVRVLGINSQTEPFLYVEGEGIVTLASLFGGDISGTGLSSFGEIIDIFPGSIDILGQGLNSNGGTVFYFTTFTTQAQSSAVPEPSSILMLFLAGGALTYRSSRSKIS